VLALSTVQFVKSLNLLETFTSALPEENYVALPDDWLVAVTDVIKSRAAISDGRYKAVNMAGVAMISAIMNALDNQQIPYIFGGDGAAVAFASEDQDVAETALARTKTWVAEELELELRAAIVPVSEIRKQKSDVKVAAIRVSDAVSNFAFIGGGIALAEKLMKEGQYNINGSAGGEYPDLSGLSCRWSTVREDGRKIVSIIIEPEEKAGAAYHDALEGFMQLVNADQENASPMPKKGARFAWPPKGISLEAKVTGMSKLALYLITLLAWVLDKIGIKLGGFDPHRYREYTALNTDYRKIQDGVRMTVSLDMDRLEQVKSYLEDHHVQGNLYYGYFEQDSAVLTCFVPALLSDTHYHFLDGAEGGYAAAADNFK